MPKPNVTRVQSATEDAIPSSLAAQSPRISVYIRAKQFRLVNAHEEHLMDVCVRSLKMLETAAQVRQTKHTGVQKTEEKNPARFVAARDRRTQGTIETDTTCTWISTS